MPQLQPDEAIADDVPIIPGHFPKFGDRRAVQPVKQNQVAQAPNFHPIHEFNDFIPIHCGTLQLAADQRGQLLPDTHDKVHPAGQPNVARVIFANDARPNHYALIARVDLQHVSADRAQLPDGISNQLVSDIPRQRLDHLHPLGLQ
jgi:hypothetical protein